MQRSAAPRSSTQSHAGSYPRKQPRSANHEQHPTPRPRGRCFRFALTQQKQIRAIRDAAQSAQPQRKTGRGPSVHPARPINSPMLSQPEDIPTHPKQSLAGPHHAASGAHFSGSTRTAPLAKHRRPRMASSHAGQQSGGGQGTGVRRECS